MDVYNISFDKLLNNIVQARRKYFLDDHTSPTFIKERVIVSNTRQHPTALTEANLAYAGETTSNVKYAMAKNEQMTKNLYASRKEAENSEHQCRMKFLHWG